MFVEGDLDGGIEPLFLDGFEQISERLGCFRPFQRRAVGFARQINDGQVESLTDNSRSVDAVHFSLKANIHEHEIGMCRGHDCQRFLTRMRYRGHFVAKIFQPLLNVFGEEAFVLHHNDACLVHMPHSIATPCGKTSRTASLIFS